MNFKELSDLIKKLEKGEITQKEFKQKMRSYKQELKEMDNLIKELFKKAKQMKGGEPDNH